VYADAVAGHDGPEPVGVVQGVVVLVAVAREIIGLERCLPVLIGGLPSLVFFFTSGSGLYLANTSGCRTQAWVRMPSRSAAVALGGLARRCLYFAGERKSTLAIVWLR
jgi:hypothetical protein